MALYGNILIWLSGGDPDVLRVSTISERRKFTKLGLVVFIPGILAWIGMWFASYYIGILNNGGRFIAASIWALIIIIMDTYMVSTLDKRIAVKNPRKFTILVCLRIFVAIFCGIIMSHPLVLKILERNINEQIEVSRNQQIAHLITANRDKAIRWNEKNRADMKQLATDIDCRQKTQKAEGVGAKVDYGCGLPSGKPGAGTFYKRLSTEILQKTREYDSLNIVVRQIQEKLEAKNAVDIKNFNKHFSDDYLKRVTALTALQKADIKNGDLISHTSVLTIALMIFFVLLDSLAVLSKVIVPAGIYEQLLSEKESFQIRNADRESTFKENLLIKTSQQDQAMRIALINAVYRRAAHHTPQAIQQTVAILLSANDLSDIISGRRVSRNEAFKTKFWFLIITICIGLLVWYILQLPQLKVTNDSVSIAMGFYTAIISIIAGFTKFDYD